MAFLSKENKYDWDFEVIGGCSRVQITKGEDIAHLDELDPKKRVRRRVNFSWKIESVKK